MNHEEQEEYQEKMGGPEMEYLQYQSEQQPELEKMPLHTIIEQCLPKEKAEKHEELFSHRSGYCKCTYNDAIKDVKSTIPTIVELLIAEIEKMLKCQRISVKTKAGVNDFTGEVITIPLDHMETSKIVREATIHDIINLLKQK